MRAEFARRCGRGRGSKYRRSTTEKTAIADRNGLELVIEHELIPNPKGLVFVIPGLGGTHQQPHLQTIAEAFHVITGAAHTFREPAHLAALKSTVSERIKASLK
ncbi:MAG: hypothetical protein A3J59_03980 [Candidatus Buchananbacteria bacterium RIFCSPHIGHO2_02_FULL_56_16]|uniref:Uncharacterized protein n=1 Tax=Candidatus Buchananbacteria bacterium RIFCSPHIGHO2_02_FULL_56_16 TaxID=1797542 RepID=A0A1G1YKR4_9BACT|nr:MAG: hypothetical protein A3J59_03980 [Candidatus Buchananbacteria bacterium RIFCSPHIGHO2_02_FULL_56_16]